MGRRNGKITLWTDEIHWHGTICMFVQIHTCPRRFLHVSVGRLQHLFLWKGDADICTSFILVWCLPICSSLKFFSFNFSAATHILIGTLCLRKDSGIGVSTWLLLWLWSLLCVSVVAGGGDGHSLQEVATVLFLFFPSFILSLILKEGSDYCVRFF